MKRALRRIARALGLAPAQAPSSTAYEIIDRAAAAAERFDGWLDRSVAEKQDEAFRKLLRAMYDGSPRLDLAVAAEAVRSTGFTAPSLLEVGCGSGYYSEVLEHMLGSRAAYTGLDYSEAMIDVAREHYPNARFVVGDATALPFDDGAFDIVMNGVALMHIIDYEKAIAESARATSGWCIFHTVPVLEHRATTFLKKKAYGLPTVEVIFNEAELLGHFKKAGLGVQKVLPSLQYDLSTVLGEQTSTKTYICGKV